MDCACRPWEAVHKCIPDSRPPFGARGWPLAVPTDARGWRGQQLTIIQSESEYLSSGCVRGRRQLRPAETVDITVQLKPLDGYHYNIHYINY